MEVVLQHCCTAAAAALIIDAANNTVINTSITDNVGIGVANPNGKLYINTSAGNGVNSFSLRIASSGGTDGANFFCGSMV